MKTSQASISLNKDISKSFHGPLIETYEFIFEEENENAHYLLYYILLFLILDNTMATFLGDNFKYVSILMNFED